VIDPQFAEYGLRLMQKRNEEVNHFSKLFGPLYKIVSLIDNVDIEYEPSWKSYNINEIITYLKNKRDRECMAGLSLSGPHRDSYFFTKNKTDFSKKASTGQKRLLALLLRLAQATRYYYVNNKKPILLLDDVLLELDGEKRIKFLSVLPEYEQAFYTFLPEEPFDKYKKDDTIVYFIKDGDFKYE
jgi:DNA replication and repair protein RecF